MTLDQSQCQLEGADFDKGTGEIHLEGGLTLDGTAIKVSVDFNLRSFSGNATAAEMKLQVENK